jgi:arginine deiminase
LQSSRILASVCRGMRSEYYRRSLPFPNTRFTVDVVACQGRFVARMNRSQRERHTLRIRCFRRFSSSKGALLRRPHVTYRLACI